MENPLPSRPITSTLWPAGRLASHWVPSPRTSKTMARVSSGSSSMQEHTEMGRRRSRESPHLTWTNWPGPFQEVRTMSPTSSTM